MRKGGPELTVFFLIASIVSENSEKSDGGRFDMHIW